MNNEGDSTVDEAHADLEASEATIKPSDTVVDIDKSEVTGEAASLSSFRISTIESEKLGLGNGW